MAGTCSMSARYRSSDRRLSSHSLRSVISCITPAIPDGARLVADRDVLVAHPRLPAVAPDDPILRSTTVSSPHSRSPCLGDSGDRRDGHGPPDQGVLKLLGSIARQGVDLWGDVEHLGDGIVGAEIDDAGTCPRVLDSAAPSRVPPPPRASAEMSESTPCQKTKVPSLSTTGVAWSRTQMTRPSSVTIRYSSSHGSSVRGIPRLARAPSRDRRDEGG